MLCILFAFLGIQIASAAHLHTDACEHGHSCAVCHAGHTPIDQAVAEIGIAPPDLTDWGVQREESPIVRCHLPASQLSRGPPA